MIEPWLKTVLFAFREVTKFYCTSNSNRAAAARNAQAPGESFYASFLQDLNDLWFHLVEHEPAELSVDAEAALADIWRLCDELEPLVLTASSPHTHRDAAVTQRYPNLDWLHGKLGLAEEQWTSLDEQQLRELRTWISLDGLATESSRRELLHKSAKAEAAVRSLRDTDILRSTRQDREHVLVDVWAERASERLSGPMEEVYNTLYDASDCDCAQFHDHVQGSFMTSPEKCTLFFCSEHDPGQPWRTEDVILAERRVGSLISHATLAHRSELPVRLEKLVSLRAWIGQNPCPVKDIDMKDRLALALLICYAFLDLGGGHWWHYMKDTIDVFLPQEPDEQPNLLRPFFLTRLKDADDSCNSSVPSHVPGQERNRHMPALPNLGILVFELVSGKEVTWDTFYEEADSFRKLQPERRVLLAAVLACAGLVEEADIFKRCPLRQHRALREAFLHQVIRKLNYHLEKGCDSRLEDMLSQAQRPRSRRRKRGCQDAQVSKRQRRSSTVAAVNEARPSYDVFCDDVKSSAEPPQSTNADPSRSNATTWMQELESVHEMVASRYSRILPSGRRIRIAVLDTGATFGQNYLESRDLKLRLQECRSWIGESAAEPDGTKLEQFEDTDPKGHGTHVTSALFETAPVCDIYVGQVISLVDDKDSSERVGRTEEQSVANAIRYAVDKWQVDIISMSFGGRQKSDIIDAAIRHAYREKVLMFACSANWGAIHPPSWMATHEIIFGIFARSGTGNPYLGSPSPEAQSYHFAAPGIGIHVWSLPDGGQPSRSPEVWRSGSSFATPIAAGIAALVLHIVYHGSADKETGEQRVKELRSLKRMNAILMRMVQHRDGYRFLAPWQVLKDYEGTSETHLVDLLRTGSQ